MSAIAEKLPAKHEFSAQLDSLFYARTGENEGFDLCLVELDDIVSNAFQENYSLTFHAPADTPPVQGVYQLEHDALGKMDLFLVPIKKDDSGVYYEAVFNQLIEAAV